MRIDGKTLRGIIREELKRSLAEGTSMSDSDLEAEGLKNINTAQYIFPADMKRGNAGNDEALAYLTTNAPLVGVTLDQMLYAAGVAPKSYKWRDTAHSNFNQAVSDAARSGTPLAGLDVETLKNVWDVVVKAHGLLRDPELSNVRFSTRGD